MSWKKFSLFGCCACICSATLMLMAPMGFADGGPAGTDTSKFTAPSAPPVLEPDDEDGIADANEQVPVPSTYFTAEQWSEIQQLIEAAASEEGADPLTVMRAAEILGFSPNIRMSEMLPAAPSTGGISFRTLPCPADSIFSQGAFEPGEGWTAGTSDQSSQLQRFESYNVLGDICDVHFWGINAEFITGTGFFVCDRTGGGTVADAYNITFYPDLAGEPDLNNPACEYLNVAVDGVVLTKTGTGLMYTTATDTFELFQYDLDLTSLGCCTLRDGWISIQGVDNGTACLFLWMGSEQGNLANCLLDDAVGPPLECGPPDHDYDLAVCLTGMVDPGACCNQDTGMCEDTPPVDYFTCLASAPNVRFIPNGVCGDFTPACGVAFGACCFDDGTCAELSNIDCNAVGGFFSGEGSTCTPNMCPQPCECLNPIISYPHYENFEGDSACGTTCGTACPLAGDWTNVDDGTDDIDWTVDAGGTGSTDTGPSMDFDPGTSTGNYVYTEGTSCFEQTAILLSPCYDLSTVGQPEFVFAYHMTGDDTGSIEVQVSVNDCISWTSELVISGQQQLDPADPWQITSVSLAPYAGLTKVRIRIIGLTGTGFETDMALDGLRVFDASSTTGACCNGDGTCTDGLTQTECEMGGGTFQGSFSTCDNSVCGGACCLPDGTCLQTNPTDCAAMGGGHQGAVACSQVNCPQPCDCTTPINTFPYNEDWEGEATCGTTCGTACPLTGGWTNLDDGTDDIDWTIDEGGTTSTTTGPSQDANPGSPTGNYAYTEASSCLNQTAILLSPCFDISGLGSPLFVFAYHMYGDDMGDLNVEVSTDNCLSWTTELTISGQQQTDDLDPWLYDSVDLSAYAGATSLRIRIRGVTGADFNSDMAVDDLSLIDGSAVTGACCLGDTCQDDTSETDCLNMGGTYLGDFSNCGSGANPCVGACCLSGACQDLNEGDCASMGGSYAGGGTLCADTICNDTCETAMVIPSVPFSTVFDTRNANPDGGPPGSCNTASATEMDKDVWLNYTPTEDCTLFLDVDPDFGVAADGIMQIYTGPDCLNLTPLGGLPGEDDPGCFDLNEPWSTQFPATAGTTYWFQVGDWGAVATAGGGPVEFNLTCVAGNFGACCLPDGMCIEVDDQMACEMAGGVYQGDLIPCTQAACPQPCSCTAPVNTFPYNEDWEGEATCSTTCGNACPLVGGWTNVADGTDDFDWTIDAGGTTSSDTGPSQDANPGTPTGNYAYTETSGTACQNTTAILLSPCFDISGLSDPTLLFGYHMTGDDMGDLFVEVSTDNCLSWTTELTISGQQQLDPTDPWRYDAVDLSLYAGSTDLRIRFRGVPGGGFESDMAIDDISVFNGPITGACCTQGVCTNDITQSDCEMGGGVWQGPLSDCADVVTCGGACCTSAGCTVVFEEDCLNLGGIYLGDDTLCSGNDCNNNGVDDECDIASGTSMDCNDNGIPDECESMDDCDGDGTPDICDPDCNMNGMSDVCDILNGTSDDCQPDGIPDECQLLGGAASVAITEVDMGATDSIEVQNVSGGVLDTNGWMVVASDTPYSDPNTVNPIIQMLPSSMAAGEVIFWTDGGTNAWGSNLFWNPGMFPTFSGWAMILDDAGNIVDFAVWNEMPASEIANLSPTIDGNVVTIGDEWVGDGVITDTLCGAGFSLQRQGSMDNNDATDWLCQASNIGSQNPGLNPPLQGVGGDDCNMNGIPDDCDIADCPMGDDSCADCNGNGIPDGCELENNDCNMNGIPDDCDIADCPMGDDSCADCNGNGIPDGCELDGNDCNMNGIPDECDIANCPMGDDSCADCNRNGIPDGCELDDNDCNMNGIPDECDVAVGEITLLSQEVIPDDNGVGPGLLFAIGSSCPFDNTSAEDFTLATSETITKISWEGVYFGAASDFPGVDANFHVTFYEDNGSGNVGAVVADFPSVTIDSKMLHGRPPVQGTNPVYTYVSTLPAPVSVNGGQRYWLSINGDPAGAGGPVFGWMASNEGNASSILGNDQPLQNTTTTCVGLPALTYTPGGDLGDQDADLALKLFGEESGTSEDCNNNGIPDECEDDCNDNGRPDDCDIADDPSLDMNGNGIIDECECRPEYCPDGSTALIDAQGDFAGWCVISSDPEHTDIYTDAVTGNLALIEVSKDLTAGPLTLTFQQICDDDSVAVSMIYIADESITNLTGTAWPDFSWTIVGSNAWLDVAASSGWSVAPFQVKTFGDFIDGPANNQALSLTATNGSIEHLETFFAGIGTGELKIGVNLGGDDAPISFDLVQESSTMVIPLVGDCDHDGDVDLTDFSVFSLCFGGANRPPAASCPANMNVDFDGDGDVDLADFAEMSLNYTGAR